MRKIQIEKMYGSDYNGYHTIRRYVVLSYSKKQHELCCEHRPTFRCNICNGLEYSEMKCGDSIEECKSNWSDATIVFRGEMEEYDELRKKGLIIYSSEFPVH